MHLPGSAVDLAFERIQLSDLPDVIELALENTDARIAGYAVEPRAAMRRARIKGWLAALPWFGARLAQPERSYWIKSDAGRLGVLLLEANDPWLHLHFVVLTRAAQGTGAADRVLAFVEEQARAAGAKGVDLYVDRRNYRAYHLYLRHGFRLTSERRFIFDVPRDSLPSPVALAAAPWHALAEVFGAIGGRGLAGRPWFAQRPRSEGGAEPQAVPLTFRQGGIASITLDEAASIDSAVRKVFRDTLARVVRVSLPFASNVRGGRLVAILQRMEKVVA